MIHPEDQTRIDAAKADMNSATGADQAPAAKRYRILENKAIRRALTDLDEMLAKSPVKSANRMLALRHIEDASMRLGKDLQECSEPNPYPNSKTTENTIVDAMAPEITKPVAPHFGGPSMPAYQERVLLELRELNERRLKLQGFFDTKTYYELNPAEKERLKRQHDMMEGYETVLGERIAAFNQ